MALSCLLAWLLLCSFISHLPSSYADLPPDPLLDPIPPLSNPSDDPSTSALSHDLHRVKEQLLILEQSLSEKDLLLQEKDKAIASLQADLETLEKEQGGELEISLKNAHAQLKDLEAKISQLGSDLEKKELELQQSKDRVAMLVVTEAEQLSAVKQLEKLVSDQKNYIGKAEIALRAAEASMLRMQAEADVKERELVKVHGGWLPPWTSIQMVKLQASVAESWNKYADPLLNTAIDKASEKIAAVQEWSKPHVEVVRKKWSPVMKQSLETVSSAFAPHVETVKSKVAEGYEASSAFLVPQMKKVQEFCTPYLQVAKDACSPYVEGVANHVRPHFERVQAVTGPYTEKAFQHYRGFLTSAASYHDQLQVSVQERMKRSDFLAPLVSKELVWFLASALLVLPVLASFLFFSSALSSSKKPIKAGKSHGGHGHRRAKRAKQADK